MITPATASSGPGEKPRCPVRGCFVRYRGGSDRLCPEHQRDDTTATANQAYAEAARYLGIRDPAPE